MYRAKLESVKLRASLAHLVRLHPFEHRLHRHHHRGDLELLAALLRHFESLQPLLKLHMHLVDSEHEAGEADRLRYYTGELHRQSGCTSRIYIDIKSWV